MIGRIRNLGAIMARSSLDCSGRAGIFAFRDYVQSVNYCTFRYFWTNATQKRGLLNWPTLLTAG